MCRLGASRLDRWLAYRDMLARAKSIISRHVSRMRFSPTARCPNPTRGIFFVERCFIANVKKSPGIYIVTLIKLTLRVYMVISFYTSTQQPQTLGTRAILCIFILLLSSGSKGIQRPYGHYWLLRPRLLVSPGPGYTTDKNIKTYIARGKDNCSGD